MGKENTETLQDQQAHGTEANEELAREEEILYARDANMIVDIDTSQHLAQWLPNYGALTAQRDVEIRWKRAGIIARLKEHGALKSQLLRPVI